MKTKEKKTKSTINPWRKLRLIVEEISIHIRPFYPKCLKQEFLPVKLVDIVI
jgi:hypothetical protein